MAIHRHWQRVLKYLTIVVALAFVLLGVLLASALLGVETSWTVISKAQQWFVGHQPGGLNRTLSTRLIVSFIFLAFLLWAIRDDLGSIWHRLRGKSPLTPFTPIEILQSIEGDKNRVRQQRFTNLYLIPVRLSDAPTKGWGKLFQKIWSKSNQKVVARLKESELLLFCRLDQVEAVFPNLKKAVGDANDGYQRLLEDMRQKAETKQREAEEKVAAKRARERSLRSSVSSTLDRVNTSRADQ
jgi:hypothetical protein